MWDGDYRISAASGFSRYIFQGSYCKKSGIRFGTDTPSLSVSEH